MNKVWDQLKFDFLLKKTTRFCLLTWEHNCMLGGGMIKNTSHLFVKITFDLDAFGQCRI
jgi:hypothetical protein